MNSAFGGATRDALIFGQSMLKVHLESIEMEKTYLLGDAGYPLREYLLTPIAKAEENSPEAQYNALHKRAYATPTVGNELQFEPATAAKIFLACCLLHNMCVKGEVNVAPKSEVLRESHSHPGTSKPVSNGQAKPTIGAFKRGQLERERVVQLLTGK